MAAASSPLLFSLALLFITLVAGHYERFLCPTAIFSFSDSLSDAGNRNLEFNNLTVAGAYPYGLAAHHASGRYSDGLVITDYLAQYLGHGNELIASLAYNGSSFKGLNFGYAGATVITVPGLANGLASAHNFSVQIGEFISHKKTMQRELKDYSQQWFENALYYVQIGGDDINFNIAVGFDGILRDVVPRVIEGLRNDLLRLYSVGAKRILLFNMPRADCSPFYLNTFFGAPVSLDNLGCIVELGRMIQQFNSEIKQLADDLTTTYLDLTVHYFDWFAANTEVLQNMNQYNFVYATKGCCGSGPGNFNCGGPGLCGCASGVPNVNYTVCKHPDNYITFDGIHYTQHFYKIMADFLMSGSFVTPPLALIPGCQVHSS